MASSKRETSRMRIKYEQDSDPRIFLSSRAGRCVPVRVSNTKPGRVGLQQLESLCTRGREKLNPYASLAIVSDSGIR